MWATKRWRGAPIPFAWKSIARRASRRPMCTCGADWKRRFRAPSIISWRTLLLPVKANIETSSACGAKACSFRSANRNERDGRSFAARHRGENRGPEFRVVAFAAAADGTKGADGADARRLRFQSGVQTAVRRAPADSSRRACADHRAPRANGALHAAHGPSFAPCGAGEFPRRARRGGRSSPVEAALRETHEETGITAEHVSVVGYMEGYETGTGFAILPVVGVLTEGFALVPNPAEVAEIFEVPLAFLLDPKNRERQSREWQGRKREFYAFNHGGHYIWGATAAILVNFAEKLIAP